MNDLKLVMITNLSDLKRYPTKTILMSASIYLTCGITIERYIAVYDPLEYIPSTTSRTNG